VTQAVDREGRDIERTVRQGALGRGRADGEDLFVSGSEPDAGAVRQFGVPAGVAEVRVEKRPGGIGR
jgi:hypothetical protein